MTFLTRSIRLILKLLFLFFIILWLSSYFRHSAIGVDIDRYSTAGIEYHYYRMNWPGNGSILIGKGHSLRSAGYQKPLAFFDLAGVFFQPVYRQLPVAASSMNHIGFWYINLPEQQFWLGIPAWLPVLIIGFILLVIRKRS